MKTIGFSCISMKVNQENNGVELTVKVPGSDPVLLKLSADETMMFLVELGNNLEKARGLELEGLTKRLLLREQRKCSG